MVPVRSAGWVPPNPCSTTDGLLSFLSDVQCSPERVKDLPKVTLLRFNPRPPNKPGAPDHGCPRSDPLSHPGTRGVPAAAGEPFLKVWPGESTRRRPAA